MTVEYIEIRPPTEEEEEIDSIEEEQLEHQRILDEIAEDERLQQEWEQDQMSLDCYAGKNFDIPKEAEDRDYVEYIEEDEMEEEEQSCPPLELIEIFEKNRSLSHRSIKK